MITTVPSVSVLISTFNRAHFLPESLDSVLGQTIPPAQVIVINDGSTDNTREAVKPYLDRIEYLEKENGGKSRALNLAMPRVRGDYVWIMDDDDVALSDALETHLSVLEKDPSIGFTWTASYYARTGPGGKGLEIVELKPVNQLQDGELFLDLLERSIIFHPAMLCRTSCYRDVGSFDPKLIRSQDYDMILRLARRFAGRAINKPTFLYRMHSGDRGSATGRFSATTVNSKWRMHDQMIFNRLRKELELREYLPIDLRSKPLGPLETRRAYLKRMAVMAAKGMIGEMVDDLQQVLGSPVADSPLSPAERSTVVRSMHNLWFVDFSPLRQALVSRGIAAPSIPVGIRVEMARGLYWQAEAMARKQQARTLFEIVKLAWRLLGVRTLPAAAQDKFQKLVRAG